MKRIIYISGILGGLLLIIGLIGMIVPFPFNGLWLLAGVILLVLICIPLMMVDRYRYNKKIDHIIKKCKGQPSKIERLSTEKSKVKRWSMNNSPFRERKSGLTWGGGNVKGANATRGNRRKFLI
ncbi:hypothetical protein [Cyclobacterium jeungdonense]|uniref:Uncharacterized protein n=1 Tax=Cyclobacterium jeungdonense TaxID=708087 RepID=A0ABT8CCQ1_9BACT|nr:hypothetical protein [Cyclobacterium jeungdonense]MDN3689338.1 hypothetical protein [Cyclobacterium jeungdonense]